MYQIPEMFRVVLTKMYPEIKEITIDGVDDIFSDALYPPDPYVTIEHRILVHLLLHIEKPKGNHDYYSDKINQAFRYSFPNMNFVKFSVEKFNIIQPKTNKEIFTELFYVCK